MNCVRRQLTFSVEVFDHANALLKVASGDFSPTHRPPPVHAPCQPDACEESLLKQGWYCRSCLCGLPPWAPLRPDQASPFALSLTATQGRISACIYRPRASTTISATRSVRGGSAWGCKVRLLRPLLSATEHSSHLAPCLLSLMISRACPHTSTSPPHTVPRLTPPLRPPSPMRTSHFAFCPLIRPGVSTHFVDVQHIASRNAFQGPRVVEALSTSSLMMWAEEAAIAALEEHLPQGTTTVGGETNLAHVAPTPKGMQVSCKATLVQISQTRKGGHKLLFDIEGEDRVQAVMKGAPAGENGGGGGGWCGVHFSGRAGGCPTALAHAPEMVETKNRLFRARAATGCLSYPPPPPLLQGRTCDSSSTEIRSSSGQGGGSQRAREFPWLCFPLCFAFRTRVPSIN